jgi:hypothetical protein
LREVRLFFLGDPFAGLPEVFRVVRFLAAIQPSLAQEK